LLLFNSNLTQKHYRDINLLIEITMNKGICNRFR